MKKLFALLLLTPSLCFALANDMILMQRNPVDTGNITRIVPWTAVDSLFWFDGTAVQPKLVTLGTGLSITTGVLNAAAPAAPSQSAASRSLNSAFQVSTTRNALVVYSVQIQVTASIAGGQNGDVILEIASDSGFTTNVQTLAISGVGQTYTLAVALQGVQPQTQPVTGFVPAGYYTRLRTVNNVGTPVFTYRSGQEVLL